MEKELYLVYPYNYPEDYVLVLAGSTEEIIEEYCKEVGKGIMSEDEFYDEHNADIISRINGRKVKEVILE